MIEAQRLVLSLFYSIHVSPLAGVFYLIAFFQFFLAQGMLIFLPFPLFFLRLIFHTVRNPSRSIFLFSHGCDTFVVCETIFIFLRDKIILVPSSIAERYSLFLPILKRYL